MVTRLDDLARHLERHAPTPEAPLRRSFMTVALLVAYAFFAATYLPINHFSIGRDARRLFLPGEENLPFLPAFEYLYVTGYFLPLILLVWPPDVRGFVRLVQAFGLVLGVAYTTYLAFPVYLERPAFEPDTLAKWLLAIEYLDPSYNHFPSLHVAIGRLTFLACAASLGRARRPLALLVWGMCVSTLFVKQHYFVDVVFGAVLARVAWSVAGRRRTESREGGRRALPLREALR